MLNSWYDSRVGEEKRGMRLNVEHEACILGGSTWKFCSYLGLAHFFGVLKRIVHLEHLQIQLGALV
jgi:hypothetical protein